MTMHLPRTGAPIFDSVPDLTGLPTGYRFRVPRLEHVQQVMWVSPQAGGGRVHVDSGVSGLLLMTWLHGWATFASCERSDRDDAQVVFDHEHDAIEFVVAANFPGRVGVKVPEAFGWPRREVRVSVTFPPWAIDGAASAFQALWHEKGRVLSVGNRGLPKGERPQTGEHP